MTRKLLVITAGTVATGVGLEILKQMKARQPSELDVMVRYIDTAFLPNRYGGLTKGEWFRMDIDPRYMAAIYEDIQRFPHLRDMLFPGLLPSTDVSGGGSIRYNGAGAVEIQRDNLREWLSSNMADLARSGSGERSLSVALIVSAVGATGSGSLERLIEVVVDAAHNASIPEPLRCDVFILQPGMQDVTDLGLANTLALYAEMAASQLSQTNGNIRQYQGRKIMVGWGSTRALSSLEQLQEAAATLVRVASDPVSPLVAEFQEREVDNHVLRELDPLSNLPMHLSSATAITISLGRLEEQVIHRDVSRLIDDFLFGHTTSGSQTNILLGKHTEALGGETAIDRYKRLLNYLSEVIPLNRMGAGIDAMMGNEKISVAEKSSKLMSLWQEYREEINQGRQRVRVHGHTLIADAISQLKHAQRELIYQGSISLAGLREEYHSLQTALATTLAVARQDSQTAVDDTYVMSRQEALVTGWPLKLFNRQAKLRSFAHAIKNNLQEYLQVRSRSSAIEVLERLEHYCADIGRNLDVVLRELHRQRDDNQGWYAITQQYGTGSGHPLHIVALSTVEETNHYADQVSIFAPRSRESADALADVQNNDQLAEFCRWLEADGQLDVFFKGDAELLSRAVTSYVRQKVHSEMRKHTIVDVLLRAGKKTLLGRLKEAAAMANTLVSYSRAFAPYSREAWYASAYYRDEEQREDLQSAINQVFAQGQCRLLRSDDPTEVAIFYYVDGLPMSAVDDLKGRCLHAFLQRRQNWLLQQRASPNGSDTVPSLGSFNQRVGVPVYSGRDAEKLVLETGVIKRLYRVKGSEVGVYGLMDIPELGEGYGSINVMRQRELAPSLSTNDQEYGFERERAGQETEESPISLFATVRASLEEDDQAFVSKVYSVQAGISQSKAENVAAEAFDLLVRSLDEPIPFDISLHASENIDLATEWYQPLLYNPRNPEPQFVEFTFRVTAPGTSSLVIDFYHERRWLKTTRLEFDAVEESQIPAVSSEV